MRKRPRTHQLRLFSADANSSASMIMIGTCTTKKIMVLVSAWRKTGSLGQADDVVEAAEMEIHALADLEAHPERPQDRIDQEEAEQDERRRDEEPAADLLTAIEPCGCHWCFPIPQVRRARDLRRLRETCWPTPTQVPTAAPTRSGAGAAP